MKRLLTAVIALALAGLAVFWLVTAPKRTDPAVVAALTPDPVHGEQVFYAGGCSSCHAAEDSDDKTVLQGGMAFPSAFGTFYAPNISPSEQGLAGWSVLDLVNAVQHGTSPEGKHYYPAFPYPSYVRAELQDIVDLHAYMITLPASDVPSKPHDVGFPFNIRRSLGGWKLLFLRDKWIVDPGDLTEVETRGRYLAEALGHCGECHTPRNAIGGATLSKWLGGAPNPSGKGNIPNITPGKLDWSERDLVEYFTSGFTPEFDSVGGHMASVVANLSKLPESDRAAIAAYLKRVTPVP